MKRNYRFHELSREEQERMAFILLEEMDLQTWYAVAASALLGGEILIPLH